LETFERAAGGEPHPEILDLLLDVLVRTWRRTAATAGTCRRGSRAPSPRSADRGRRDPADADDRLGRVRTTTGVLLEGEHYTFLTPPDSLLALF